jgi:hypothetical protein
MVIRAANWNRLPPPPPNTKVSLSCIYPSIILTHYFSNSTSHSHALCSSNLFWLCVRSLCEGKVTDFDIELD